MFRRKSGNPAVHAVETLIGRSTRVQGDLQFEGGLHLDGAVTGNVRATGSSASVLIVSEEGAIEGSVEVPHAILNGTVRGDVIARERVELGSAARVDGNVYYGVIEMANGARINGKLIHLAAEPAADQGLSPASEAG